MTLCEILQVLEGYDMRALGFHSAQAVHVMAEAMRHAFFDRNNSLGDPAFVTNPLDAPVVAGPRRGDPRADRRPRDPIEHADSRTPRRTNIPRPRIIP